MKVKNSLKKMVNLFFRGKINILQFRSFLSLGSFEEPADRNSCIDPFVLLGAIAKMSLAGVVLRIDVFNIAGAS